ncbi:MAG: hypothetical protein AB7E80_02905 [Hyphomicrobiaceae bacterium]
MPLSGKGPVGPPVIPPKRPERAIAVAGLGAILFLQPFLGIFDRGASATVAGVPLLFAYLFGAWAVVVLLSASVMETREPGPESGDEAPGPHASTTAMSQTEANPRPADRPQSS